MRVALAAISLHIFITLSILSVGYWLLPAFFEDVPLVAIAVVMIGINLSHLPWYQPEEDALLCRAVNEGLVSWSSIRRRAGILSLPAIFIIMLLTYLLPSIPREGVSGSVAGIVAGIFIGGSGAFLIEFIKNAAKSSQADDTG